LQPEPAEPAAERTPQSPVVESAPHEQGGYGDETREPGDIEQPSSESLSKMQDSSRRFWLLMTFATVSVLVVLVVGVGLLSSSDTKDAQTAPSNWNGPQEPNSGQPVVTEPENTITSVDDKIAVVPVDICMEQVPGEGKSLICTDQDTSQRGGAVCNLVAKAMLEQFPEAHFAIQNAGSCVKDIPRGVLSTKDTLDVLPSVRSLVTVQLTGAQTILLLEQALEEVFGTEPIKSGAYPYGAGIRYSVSASENFQNRLANVEINPGLDEQASWTQINPETMYSMVTSSKLLEDGERVSWYQVFDEIPPERIVYTALDVTESFLLYVREKAVLLNPRPSEYSTQSFIA
jgi:hypothetical protein